MELRFNMEGSFEELRWNPTSSFQCLKKEPVLRMDESMKCKKGPVLKRHLEEI